jgi:multisubunit Na+/H+ antiporter MnhE subunit
MKSFAINLIIAVLWLWLSDSPTLVGFFIGFALGAGLLALFREVLDSGDYVRRLWAGLAFGAIFTREFLVASWQVMRLALCADPHRMRPQVIAYSAGDLSAFEALMLSHAISLTPGTTTVDISPDRRVLTLHVLDVGEQSEAEVTAAIDNTLKRGILAFTR